MPQITPVLMLNGEARTPCDGKCNVFVGAAN